MYNEITPINANNQKRRISETNQKRQKQMNQKIKNKK
jgi:K+-transporting ATPase c subunit